MYTIYIYTTYIYNYIYTCWPQDALSDGFILLLNYAPKDLSRPSGFQPQPGRLEEPRDSCEVYHRSMELFKGIKNGQL